MTEDDEEDHRNTHVCRFCDYYPTIIRQSWRSLSLNR